MGLKDNIRVLGSLIWGAYAGEVWNLAGAGLLVETLWVALLGNLDRDVYKNLDERDGLIRRARCNGCVDITSNLTVGLEWGDEGSEGDAGRVGKELCDLANSADVLDTILVAEAKILVEAKADVIAVEAVGGKALVE